MERKNKVFQPLVDELENQAYGEWGISQRLETPRLDECVINSYKYAFDDNLIGRDPTRKVVIKGCEPREKKIKYLSQFELQLLLKDLDFLATMKIDQKMKH